MGKRSAGDGNHVLVTQEPAAGAAAQRRQLIAWLVASAAVVSVLLSIAAVVLWYRLPEWAPLCVVKHSPWMRPLLRAEVKLRRMNENSPRFIYRIRAFGQRAGPGLVAGLSDGELAVRLLALEGLQEISYAPAVPRLVELLVDHQQEEAAQAEGALMTIKDSGCTAVVLTGLPRVDDEGREVLLTWLARHGDQRCLLAVATAYWQRAYDGADMVFDYDGLFRRVFATGDIATIRKVFKPMLNAAKPAWRMGAVAAFGELKEAAAAPDLVAALIDEDEKVRQTAVSALHDLNESCPGVITEQLLVLLKLLDPQPGPTRTAVAAMLAETRDARAVQTLIVLLRTHAWDKATRDQAIDDLIGNDDPTVAASMVEMLTGRWAVDGDRQRSCAADVLGSSRSPVVLEVLDAACRDTSSSVRVSALAARARSPDARVDGELVEALADPDEQVRRCAIQTLVELRRPAGMAALIALLDAEAMRPAPLFLSTAENQPWWLTVNELFASTYPFSAHQQLVLAAARSRKSAAFLKLRYAYEIERDPSFVPWLVLR